MTLRVHSLRVELDEKWVLTELSFEARPNQVLAVIGPPGAGKTVLLKTLAGLIPRAFGAVALNGIPIEGRSAYEWHSGVGMAFQNDALFDALSVFDNVAFPLRRRRLVETEVERRAAAILSRVGLENAWHKMPSEISGGMRKRCGIARAAVTEPRLALFDDPTAGLDPATAEQILDLVVNESRRHHGVCVVVSNALPVALARADSVLMLHEGRTAFLGSPDEIGRASDPVVHQFVRGDIEGPL
ncbi:MAG: ATP-binding cassette domain-containing protein [Myxococcota bacterium]